jgi:methionyl-tRNA formyltransferase
MTAAPASGRGVDPERTIFFGSGSFAVPLLDVVAAHPRLRLVAVVTAPDRPAGRSRALTPTPVAERARQLGAALIQPVKVRAPESVAAIAALEPSLGVLADYGQIIPGALLETPSFGILGVHPSLLPAHRGATPIQATILRGDPVAGVTVYRMDAGIDTGPILAALDWPLSGTETAPSLEADAAERGARLLEATVAGYLDGVMQPIAQTAIASAPTRPLRREDARLDPANPAVELERLVRAFGGWPGTFIETADGRVIVNAASVAPAEPGDAPGRLVRHDGRAAMVTSDGRLVLEGVQLAGRRALTGEDFLRGRPGLVDTEVQSAAPRTVR